MFEQPYQQEAQYFGVYGSFDEARADAPESMPNGYDLDIAARLYRQQLEQIRVIDFPAMHWLTRVLPEQGGRVFDLGGHIGLAYYGFQRYLRFDAELAWDVHDVPAVMAAGREWARTHDVVRRLSFRDSPDAVDGADVLFTSGALQYLPYRLDELLGRLAEPPGHIIVNMLPLHPHHGFHTLQNIGFSICPYRIDSRARFLEALARLGYEVLDEWSSREYSIEIPIEPECGVDRFHGFCLRRTCRAGESRTAARVDDRLRPGSLH